ncbi:hypothetical protein [Bradyrhizobium valentinum]|uniref:hypothetical protein n=1 Tax=Bradyrhizobium valentinum TaxID=1518501 RepID=UPI0018D21E6B|nr:hypothetical protein [Bradyrhizobium valentinum]
MIVNVLSISKPQLHAKTSTLLRANACWMTPHIAPEIMLMVELLGSGVAPGHHRRAFGDAEIALPSPVLGGQAVAA